VLNALRKLIFATKALRLKISQSLEGSILNILWDLVFWWFSGPLLF